MSKMNYVQHSDSKVDNLENRLTVKELFFAAVVSLLTAVLMVVVSPANIYSAILVMLITGVSILLFSQYLIAFLQRRLDGYTGDCLGAGQQITEIIIYLCCAAAVTVQWL